MFFDNLCERTRQQAIENNWNGKDEIIANIVRIEDYEYTILSRNMENRIKSDDLYSKVKNNCNKFVNNWCSLYKTKSHNNSDCNAQKGKSFHNKHSEFIKPTNHRNNNSMMIIEPKPSNDFLRLEIFINSSIQLAILDTGSNFNIISAKIIKNLSIETKNFDYSHNVQGISFDLIEINKYAEITFKIEDCLKRKKIIKSKFFVMNNANFDIILGNDFLNTNDALIDFPNKKIILCGEKFDILDKSLEEWNSNPDKALINKVNSAHITSNFKKSIIKIIDEAKL
ncbi:hypothetical protein DMUE_1533 [Dictyocoela muelleri]|nr:hypothetical protein DMUE_1533 [Dictyocoela muelleri]